MGPVGFFIASIALTAVSTYIQHQSAKKKEKRLKALNDERASLQKKQNALMLQEKKRTLNAETRKMVANRNNRLSVGGRSAESASEQQGNTSLLSRTEGAIDFTEEAGQIDDNLIDNSGAINAAQNSTMGLGSQLLAGAAQAGASAAASKV
jgi:hypothetical protein